MRSWENKRLKLHILAQLVNILTDEAIWHWRLSLVALRWPAGRYALSSQYMCVLVRLSDYDEKLFSFINWRLFSYPKGVQNTICVNILYPFLYKKKHLYIQRMTLYQSIHVCEPVFGDGADDTE